MASGGRAPVATFSGKLSALRSVRPEASWKPRGSSSVNRVCSSKGPGKVIWVTTLSASAWLPSPSSCGLVLPAPDTKRMPSACLRGTGALKLRLIGRIGRQADWAFSRSQLKLAENGSRTR